jgi:hypothetical protein
VCVSARTTPKARILVMLTIAAFAILYAGVVALYALNERTVSRDGCLDTVAADQVGLSLTPTAMDAAADRLSLTVGVVSFGPFESESIGIPDEDLTLVITETDGPRAYTFGADEIPSPIAVRLVTDGQIEKWPFDTHNVQFAVAVLHEVDGDMRPVPLDVCGSTHVPGWTFSSDQVAGEGDLVLAGEPVDEISLTASRSAATVAFGIIIVGLMIVMPVLGLTVAIRVLRGERRAEATLMSWLAAMLFATIPLRTFLPGSPPIGSWVDYLVVLWVVAGLIAALVIYVVAWLKWSAPGERPRR